jgi:hypothetical protein
MSTAEIYTIFCLIEGQENPFSVEIPSNKMVDHLKKAIKIERFKTLADVEAATLKLYHVSILMPDPQDTDEEDTDIDYAAKAQEVMSKPQLPHELRYPARELVHVFKGTPPKATLHIIVRRPPGKFSH